MKVLRAALALIEREKGPVLEDFPEDAPGPAPTSLRGPGSRLGLASRPVR